MILCDEVQPGKEDMEAVNDEGGNVPVAIKKSRRIKFLLHQMEMIPTKNRDFYCNMMRNLIQSLHCTCSWVLACWVRMWRVIQRYVVRVAALRTWCVLGLFIIFWPLVVSEKE